MFQQQINAGNPPRRMPPHMCTYTRCSLRRWKCGIFCILDSIVAIFMNEAFDTASAAIEAADFVYSQSFIIIALRFKHIQARPLPRLCTSLVAWISCRASRIHSNTRALLQQILPSWAEAYLFLTSTGGSKHWLVGILFAVRYFSDHFSQQKTNAYDVNYCHKQIAFFTCYTTLLIVWQYFSLGKLFLDKHFSLTLSQIWYCENGCNMNILLQ